MTAASGVTGVSGQQGAQATDNDAFKNLDLDAFLQILVTELQNQDPMQPMNNTELLQQVSQIRSIQSNDQLNSTLQSVSLGQNLITAGNMLNQNIAGLDDNGNKITGVVDRVTIDNGVATLHVGNDTVKLQNVSEILPANGG